MYSRLREIHCSKLMNYSKYCYFFDWRSSDEIHDGMNLELYYQWVETRCREMTVTGSSVTIMLRLDYCNQLLCYVHCTVMLAVWFSCSSHWTEPYVAPTCVIFVMCFMSCQFEINKQSMHSFWCFVGITTSCHAPAALLMQCINFCSTIT